jgi:hypothetical protein
VRNNVIMRLRTLALALALSCGATGVIQAAPKKAVHTAKSPKGKKSKRVKPAKLPKRFKASNAKPRKASKTKRAGR